MIRLFRVYVPVGTLALLISEIILLAAAFGVATHTTMVDDSQSFLFYDGGWIRISIVILSILIGLYFHDLFVKSALRKNLMEPRFYWVSVKGGSQIRAQA